MPTGCTRGWGPGLRPSALPRPSPAPLSPPSPHTRARGARTHSPLTSSSTTDMPGRTSVNTVGCTKYLHVMVGATCMCVGGGGERRGGGGNVMIGSWSPVAVEPGPRSGPSPRLPPTWLGQATQAHVPLVTVALPASHGACALLLALAHVPGYWGKGVNTQARVLTSHAHIHIPTRTHAATSTSTHTSTSLHEHEHIHIHMHTHIHMRER